jgi:predicted dehydrogenase
MIKNRPNGKGSPNLHEVDVDDWALCTIEMKDGGIGSLEVSRVSGGAEDVSFLEIYGKKASIRLDLSKRNQIEFFNAAKNKWESGSVLPKIIVNGITIRHYGQPAAILGPFMDAHSAAILDFFDPS